jgi:hypothetical protein
MTVREMAEILGLKTWDGALPQDWFDSFLRVTGVSPFGQFVWCYDFARSYGEPIALTAEAQHLLARYNKENN